MTDFGPRSLDGGLDRIPLGGAADGFLTDRHSGQLWICGKHVVGPDPDQALQRANQAGTIVCLNEEHELSDRYPDYVAWLNDEANGKALWFPIPDLHAPDAVATTGLVDQVVDRLDSGVIIHCGAGIGRAPTIAICVLMQLGMNSSKACDLVAEHRPMAGPESGAQSELVNSFRPGNRPTSPPPPSRA